MKWIILCLLFISCSQVQQRNGHSSAQNEQESDVTAKKEKTTTSNEEKSDDTTKEEKYRVLKKVRKFENFMGELLDEMVSSSRFFHKELGDRYVERPTPSTFLGFLFRLFPNAVGTTVIRSSSFGFDDDKAYDQYLKGSTDQTPNHFSAFNSVSIFRLQPPLGKDKWHIRFSPSFKYYNASFTEQIYFRFVHAAMMMKVQYDLPKYGSLAVGLGGGPMWFDGHYDGIRETEIKPFVSMFRADFYHYFTEHLVLGISHNHHVFLGDNFNAGNIEVENFFETGIFMAFAINLLSP